MRALGIVDFRIRVLGDWMSFMKTPRTSDLLGNQVAREVFTGLPRRYDRLAWLLSFGPSPIDSGHDKLPGDGHEAARWRT